MSDSGANESTEVLYSSGASERFVGDELRRWMTEMSVSEWKESVGEVCGRGAVAVRFE
ncbi:hypothetical protein [Haladaptatus cibarius]|uniref:hypothetical protein n=1 Tax=Haladaptatus cibarius TaxID=453847 RepID=UPI000AB5A3E4|nr:hypothetical protein [Haladaptatus cibarius]